MGIHIKYYYIDYKNLIEFGKLGTQCGLDERKRPVNWKELGPWPDEFKSDGDGFRREGHPRQFQTDRRTRSGGSRKGLGASWENSELGPLVGSIGMRWIR